MAEAETARAEARVAEPAGALRRCELPVLRGQPSALQESAPRQAASQVEESARASAQEPLPAERPAGAARRLPEAWQAKPAVLPSKPAVLTAAPLSKGAARAAAVSVALAALERRMKVPLPAAEAQLEAALRLEPERAELPGRRSSAE